ncbi:MAG: F0F1 ATP synthase subunit gamma, partial [Tetragenococcus koreensis]
MAASLNEIRDRIASTKKTGQITKAMQMVSASKLTKSETNSKQFQIYASKIRELVTHIVAGQLTDVNSVEKLKQLNPMLVRRPVKRTAYIVITSDGGLVGNYNSSILKQMMTMLQEDHDSSNEYVMITIGGTGADFFNTRGIDIAYELRNLSDQP